MEKSSTTIGAAHTAKAIPFKRESDVDSGTASGAALGTVLIALLVCAAVVYLRKRLNLGSALRAPGARHFRILEIRRLGARSHLAAVEFGDRVYLLAENERGVTTIASAQCPAGEVQ